MNNYTIISGKFARVAAGNCTEAWLIEGDDLQVRANANLGDYWRVEGVDCGIFERDIEGHALAIDGRIVGLFTTREFAEAARDRQIKADDAWRAQS